MKSSLRQTALARRKTMSSQEVEGLSQKISANLLTLLQSMQPCTVGLFYPTRGEPNLLGLAGHPVLEAFEWSLPVCTDSSAGPLLQFARYDSNSMLEAGRYNIPVPAEKEWVQPEILLIPCVAFHAAGARLGYGAGWYDRTLNQSNPRPVTIGVSYSFSEVPTPFAEQHDQLLDWVVTDRVVLQCG